MDRKDLEFASCKSALSGSILSPHEVSGILVGLTELQFRQRSATEVHVPAVNPKFWGRICGEKKNYYICYMLAQKDDWNVANIDSGEVEFPNQIGTTIVPEKTFFYR